MFVFLQRNLAWMLLAVALSTALWTVVTTQQNPDVVDAFQAVPVELRNPPRELTVRNEVPPVRVYVAAPRDVWSELRSTRIQAWVDLAREGPGLRELPVQAQSLEPRARIDEIAPQKVIVHLEPIQNKEVPARVRTTGDLPAGYRQQGTPRATPETVVVTGPKSLVDQVAAVVADIDLSGVTTSINQVYRVTPQNAAGERVDRVGMGSENVLVELRVEQQRAIKTVAISVPVVGAVAPGYQMVGVRVDPSAITLEGEPRAVETLESVPTQPVDITNATADQAVNATLQLPPGVQISRAQAIVVRVLVSPIEGSKSIELAPIVQDVRPSSRASLVPPTVRVTFDGPIPVLAELGPANVRLIVSAGGLTAGAHQVRPRVEAPALARVQATEPDRIELRITDIEPTPTVQPTPAPTRTPG